MDRLTNRVRRYAWGSTTAIPALLGTAPTGEPQAELWMGAHPQAPSLIDRGAGPVSLAEVIAADPRGELGATTVEHFGAQLPFLLKVLAAAAPLSVQVHPDLAQARQGFAAEQQRGVPMSAGSRNYKDANHKPELICALEPFDALCGFRAAPVTAQLLEDLGVDSLKPYVDILRAQPESAALREVLTAVLSADREQLADTAHQATRAAERLSDGEGPFASACRAYAFAAHGFPGDPGVIAAMLLNFIRLQPGEALFLGAGVPHAYLSGVGVEIMANSDNVLRCGLTGKHVDVPELLRVVDFRSAAPEVLHPIQVPAPTPSTANDGARCGGLVHDAVGRLGPPAVEERYPAPIDEFRLSRIVLDHPASISLLGCGPQILLCTSGRVRLCADNGGSLILEQGESAFVGAGSRLDLAGEGTVFRATVAV